MPVLQSQLCPSKPTGRHSIGLWKMRRRVSFEVSFLLHVEERLNPIPPVVFNKIDKILGIVVFWNGKGVLFVFEMERLSETPLKFQRFSHNARTRSLLGKKSK